MTGNDKIFISLITGSVLLLGVIITQNATGIGRPGSGQAPGISVAAESTMSSPQQILATKEKFQKMGLPLHEGKYWITL